MSYICLFIKVEIMKIKPFAEKKQLSESVVHENPLLNRIYQNRGVEKSEDLDYGIAKLLNPKLMKGMEEGTDVLINHILADSNILIIGDYDCDGATSTTIAVEGLKMLGAKNVDFLIPDRIKHGYGLSPSIVELAGESEPDLIITVDNGIAAFEGALAVKDLKKPCQLLITDHHLPAESGEVPEADAIINPSQPGCQFPSKNIAGCGVMFYTIIGLRAKMRAQGVFDKLNMKEPSLEPLFDVVALGTIADVVKLDLNNRIIVKNGLKMIHQGKCRPGLKKLLQLAGREDMTKIVSTDFGFGAGPRINAAGRLDDMTVGIRCLLEKNESRADALATRLDDLNAQRKEIESDMLEDALGFLDTLETDNDGVALYNGTWHEGVVGILASRVKDRLNRPTICFTDTHELAEAKERLKQGKNLGMSSEELADLQQTCDEMDIKGSSRSIPGVHLKHLFDKINKRNPEVLSKFGGHSMAAGLSIRSDALEIFRDMFDELVADEMTDDMRLGSVEVDIKNVDPELLTLENAELIHKQGIWGQGFESPLFSQEFEVVSKKVLKEKHLKLRVKIKDSDVALDAIAFNCVDRGELPVQHAMEASFSLSINEWRGKKTLQLMIDHLQDPDLAYSLEMAEKEKDMDIELLGAGKSQKSGQSLEDMDNMQASF